MTVFKPCGGGGTIHHKAVIQKTTKILDSTQDFDIVHENGGHVLDTKNSLNSQERYPKPSDQVQSTGRALSQALNEHEKQRSLQRTRRTWKKQLHENPSSRQKENGGSTSWRIALTERGARSAGCEDKRQTR